MSKSKPQQPTAFYWPKLPKTQSSSGPTIPLETLLRPKLGSLNRSPEAGSEACSEAGSQAGSQVGSQSGSQSGLQPGSWPGSDAATQDALNECQHQRSRWQSRLAQVCWLRAVYGPIVPCADIYEQAIDSVSNGSRPSLRVRVRVGTKPEPDWWSGSSITPNCRFGYGSIDITLPVWIGRVPSRLYSGSICKFI